MSNTKKRKYVTVPQKDCGSNWRKTHHTSSCITRGKTASSGSTRMSSDGARMSSRVSSDDVCMSLGDARVSSGACASFFQIYESRDALLNVFEDKQGHLTAVPSSRLAP